MSAPVPVDAIKCQIAAIVNHALENDLTRLPIRAAFRDALQAVERDGDKLRVIPQRPCAFRNPGARQ
jgi:hypothetical protein